MIPKFRVWLPDPDVEKMLRVKALIFENDKTRCMCGYAYDFYLEDENATIMQSTGLFDKNGQEIFEGDILEIQGLRMVVKFGSYRYLEPSNKGRQSFAVVYDGLGFYVKNFNVIAPDDISPFEPETLKESVVTGNIYENPDLLEVIK